VRPDLNELAEAEFDVVVIGGGINGSSSAQQLAASGYSVLLVDKGDFASGASARSSRILHCGLRYLAPGRSIFDFARHPTRLVSALRMARLAMEARAEFVKTNPERVASFTLHFPIYRDGPYRTWQMRAAFRLLAALGPKDVPLEHRMLTPAEGRNIPLIAGLRDFEKLEAVATFREFQFDWPERVAIDAIEDARRMGALVRNHTAARMVGHESGVGWTVELTDMLKQTAPVTVRGRMVLNMAGLWIDEVLRSTSPAARRKVFGTKGCHILVKLPDECRGLGIATLNSLHEPFYCLPWREFHYFGPTETPYEGDPDEVFVTGAEQTFLLAEANRLLPDLKLTESDVRMTWAGVRPLTYDEAVPFGNRSRVVHDLSEDGLPDAFAMTAGPVMTHRSAGREMAQIVSRRLRPSRPPAKPHYAAQKEPNGCDAMPADLSDVLFRRLGIGWSGPLPDDTVAGVAAMCAKELGWDVARCQQEIRAFHAQWARLHEPPGAGGARKGAVGSP
jgi:glycerol-3-phosphate dehydrogenase